MKPNTPRYERRKTHLPPQSESTGLSQIERLLIDPRFGVNWGRYWRDVLMYRRTGGNENLFAGPLFVFLANAFNANQGWDQITRAFIEADGNIYERGETALFTAQGVEPVDVAAESSRVFLGIKISVLSAMIIRRTVGNASSFTHSRPSFREFASGVSPAGKETRS